MHLAKHKVKDESGASHSLYTSLDIKGMLGTDNRKYLLELYRLTPIDITFLEGIEKEGGSYPHKLAFLRPELLDQFYDSKLKAFVMSKLEPSEKTEDGQIIPTIEQSRLDGWFLLLWDSNCSRIYI